MHLDQPDPKTEVEQAELPIARYLFQHLCVVLIVAIDLVALLALIIGLYKLVSKGPEDLSGALSLFGGTIGIYAIWKMANQLVTGDSADRYQAPTTRRLLLLAGHLLFLAGTMALWLVILPWYSQIDYSRGREAKQQKQYALAIDSYTRALYKNTQNIAAHYALGDIYQELSNWEAAVRHYRMGIHSDAGFHPRAFNNLARLLLTRDDAIAALDLLDLAAARVDKAPAEEAWAQQGIIRKNRAWAYWKLGLYGKAMKEITRAQQLLGSAHRLAELPEVSCLHALIARDSGKQSKDAEQVCLSNYEAKPKRRRNDQTSSENIRPLQGVSREIYLQVLKQSIRD